MFYAATYSAIDAVRPERTEGGFDSAQAAEEGSNFFRGGFFALFLRSKQSGQTPREIRVIERYLRIEGADLPFFVVMREKKRKREGGFGYLFAETRSCCR